jgi:PKD repeat protein
MKKSPRLQSGIFNPRILTATVLSIVGVSLAMLTFTATASNRKATPKQTTTTNLQPVHGAELAPMPAAPSPTGGTLSTSNRTLTYTDPVGPVPNATGEGVGFSAPTCAMNGVDCSNYTVTLDPSIFSAAAGYDPTKNSIVIQLTWSPSAEQYGSFVEDKNGTVIASNTAGLDPETITIAVPTINPANGPFTIVTTLEIGSPGTGYSGTVSLVAGPACAGTTAAASPAPRYQIYPSTIPASSTSGLESSIGVDWNPNVASLKQTAPGNLSHGPTLLNTGGIVMFTETFNQDQVSFDDCSSPAVNTWTNTSFVAQQTTTLDAIGFTDHFTTAALGTSYPPPNTPGRTFHGQLTAGDSNMSFTDDDGATHIQTQGGGVPQGPDHETVGGGPYNPNSTPPPPPNAVYANAIYYCTQNIAPEAECSRSDDGGLTFGPGVPIYNPQQCVGSIHGHVKVARDGTVYVPNYSCTLPGSNQGVTVSLDNGLTWTERNVPGSGSPKSGLVDPSVGIGLNDVGKPGGQTPNSIYFGYNDSDGTAKIAVSHDRGITWSTPQNVGAPFCIVNSTFPVVVAGDDNRAAFGFLGTTTTGNSSTDPSFKGVWHLYIATTYDGGNSWATIDATPDDPVQVGPVCNGGTFCSTPRNLLDFNGFDVDSQGRGVLSFADGCVNCTNSSAPSDSVADQATVARQSGGPRLFAGPPGNRFDPVEPAPPANPQAVSAVKGAGGVLVSWLEPDNGGDPALYPITGYNIYRGTSTGAEAFLAHVTNDATHKNTKYLDTTTLPTVSNYFYHVAAVNNIGESGFCEELSIASITGCLLGGSPCAAPFSTVDCAGAAGTVPTDPSTGELTIQNVSIGEPFTSCTDNSLTLVMRVQTLDPSGTGMTVLPPNSEWQILFNITDTNGSPRTAYVAVSTIPPNTPATPSVTLGRRDPRTGGAGTIDSGICTQSATSTCAILSGTETKDGTITFKLNTGNVITFGTANSLAVDPTPFMWDARNPGTQLSSVGGNTYVLVGAGAGLLETVTTTGVTGSYTRVGNISCSDKPPVAVLSANPLSGNAPLSVTFNASASNEPAGACGTINSYTLDFGDGSAPVTQDGAHPMFSHSYTKPGAYPARLTVGDTAGLVSTNPAQVVITVTSAAPPALASQTPVVSRMTHGTAGMFNLNLPLTGTRGVECRSGGANGNYTIVFTFANNLTSVDSATVTTGAGTVSSTVLGPNAGLNLNANQFEVNLTGVTNAQYLAVSLVNAKDSTGAIGNIIGPQMGVLIGDTTANGAVNSSDIAQTQSQSGQSVTASNFREDVTVNGSINSSDIALVQSKSGTGLPSSP